MSILVEVDNKHHFKNIPNNTEIQCWVDKALRQVPNPPADEVQELHISVVDKDESANLNLTHRHKAGATNILSFAYDALPGVVNESLGDLIICAELVAQEAQQQEKSITAHWAHLIIHGILHLLGYNHINEQDASKMEALEIEILAQLDFANPYES